MDTRTLYKIHSRYNADHDIGPDAPIHWSVEELAELVGKMIERIDELEAQVERLQSGSELEESVRIFGAG